MKSKKSKKLNNKKLYEIIKKLSDNHDELKKCLSSERLKPYEEIAILSPKLDIALYNVIQLQSSLLFLPLQYLEVCLRNKINNSLCQFYKKRSSKITLPGTPEEWYSWMPISKGISTSINNALESIKHNIKGQKITSNDIISHLSFGIWRHILSERPDNKDPLYFWNGVVHEIFPNTTNKKEIILQTLGSITKIRNRLFHHEPLWDTKKKNSTVEDALQDIRKKYMTIISSRLLSRVSHKLALLITYPLSCKI